MHPHHRHCRALRNCRSPALPCARVARGVSCRSVAAADQPFWLRLVRRVPWRLCGVAFDRARNARPHICNIEIQRTRLRSLAARKSFGAGVFGYLQPCSFSGLRHWENRLLPKWRRRLRYSNYPTVGHELSERCSPNQPTRSSHTAV